MDLMPTVTMTYDCDTEYDDEEEGCQADDDDGDEPLRDEVAAVIPHDAPLTFLDNCK